MYAAVCFIQCCGDADTLWLNRINTTALSAQEVSCKHLTARTQVMLDQLVGFVHMHLPLHQLTSHQG